MHDYTQPKTRITLVATRSGGNELHYSINDSLLYKKENKKLLHRGIAEEFLQSRNISHAKLVPTDYGFYILKENIGDRVYE